MSAHDRRGQQAVDDLFLGDDRPADLASQRLEIVAKAVKFAAGNRAAGSLAVGIAESKPLLEAASFANYVAALSVTRMGAQSSMPTLQEVRDFMSI